MTHASPLSTPLLPIPSEPSPPRPPETIAAIATALGEGGIGVIRISGTEALSIAKQIFRPRRPIEVWEGHRLYYGHFTKQDGGMLDEGLCVWMPEGRSFTGEDVVEIQAHGGRLNLLQLLRRCLEAGCRLAEPGEFSKRAFLSGRIDLTQAEAIADLIAAKTEEALTIARSHLQGRLRDRFNDFAKQTLFLAAHVESWIDFPEEFDPALDKAVAQIFADIQTFREELRSLEESFHKGRRLQEGWALLLLGRPNAGKSSLFNRLAGSDRALVSALPGTTRDLLDTQIALGGLQMTLIDTAGLRKPAEGRPSLPSPKPLPRHETFLPSHETFLPRHETSLPRHETSLPSHETSLPSHETSLPSHEAIEAMGIEKALKAAGQANLLLAVLDLSEPWGAEEEAVAQACKGRPVVLLLNKADRPRRLEEEKLGAFEPQATFVISCRDGRGIDDFRSWLRQYMEEETPSQELLITSERQRVALAEAGRRVEEAMTRGRKLGPEFVAEDLRSARSALAEITGQIHSEDILTVLFSTFCIGK